MISAAGTISPVGFNDKAENINLDYTDQPVSYEPVWRYLRYRRSASCEWDLTAAMVMRLHPDSHGRV